MRGIAEHLDDFMGVFNQHGVPAWTLGQTTPSDRIIINNRNNQPWLDAEIAEVLSALNAKNLARHAHLQ